MIDELKDGLRVRQSECAGVSEKREGCLRSCVWRHQLLMLPVVSGPGGWCARLFEYIVPEKTSCNQKKGKEKERPAQDVTPCMFLSLLAKFGVDGHVLGALRRRRATLFHE